MRSNSSPTCCGKLGGVGELAFDALAFQFAQQRDQAAHAAGGARAGATVGQAAHFRGVARLDGGFKLLDLLAGLLQVKRHQFAQVFRIAIGELEQPFHVHRRRPRLHVGGRASAAGGSR